MNEERCENCRFWKEIIDEIDREGMCRRFPPQTCGYGIVAGIAAIDDEDEDAPGMTIYHGGVACFPETSSEDWCGEFKPKKVALSVVAYPNWDEFFGSLSLRTRNAFRRDGEKIIDSFEALLSLTEDDLFERHSFGHSCLKDVNKALAKHNMKIKDD